MSSDSKGRGGRRPEQSPGQHSTIPVSWRSGTNVVPGNGLISASEDELRRHGHGGHVCGECDYFEHGHGQHEIKTQRFMERLVREYEWKAHHLCTPEHLLGLCGAGAGEVLTGPMHAACDQFRPDRGRLRTIPGHRRRTEQTQVFDCGRKDKR